MMHLQAQVEELRSALTCLEHCIYIGEGSLSLTGQSMPKRSSMINHPARHRHEVAMKWRVFFIQVARLDSRRV
jgi:hypothetical protein